MNKSYLSALIVILQLQYTTASTTKGNDILFGYSDSNGPNTDSWPSLCHTGTRQSPINIDLVSTVKSRFSPLRFHNYDFRGPISVINNGHSVTATGFKKWGGDGSKQPYITGAGLKGRYELVGFHFHWGTHDDVGSEHTLNGLHYPLEAHFVHRKANRTSAEIDSEEVTNSSTSEEDNSGELAVVGVWYHIDNSNWQPLRQLETAYKNTEVFGQTYDISDIRLDDMIPPNRANFFRYDGSLTTPPCDEIVTWTVLEQPLTVTDSQLWELRQHSSTMGNVLHNFRDVQPLNNRKVMKN